MHENVFLLGRSRLRALVEVFGHDMQIQVAHALCKQGCRLIIHTANKRLVTIEACYNCPRSPLLGEELERESCSFQIQLYLGTSVEEECGVKTDITKREGLQNSDQKPECAGRNVGYNEV